MKLEDLRGWMKGEDAVVVGCGPSSHNGYFVSVHDIQQQNAQYRVHWTLACNRSVKIAHPDFAVCVEPFVNPIWPIMREASPLIVFAHICEDRRGKKPHPRIVQVGSKNVLEWLAPESFAELTLNQSPFIAAAVAVFLGFETIGLIGVDLTEDRYPDVTRPNIKWQALVTVASDLGSRIINLNPESRLETVPQGTWEEIKRK